MNIIKLLNTKIEKIDSDRFEGSNRPLVFIIVNGIFKFISQYKRKQTKYKAYSLAYDDNHLMAIGLFANHVISEYSDKSLKAIRSSLIEEILGPCLIFNECNEIEAKEAI